MYVYIYIYFFLISSTNIYIEPLLFDLSLMLVRVFSWQSNDFTCVFVTDCDCLLAYICMYILYIINLS